MTFSGPHMLKDFEHKNVNITYSYVVANDLAAHWDGSFEYRVS